MPEETKTAEAEKVEEQEGAAANGEAKPEAADGEAKEEVVEGEAKEEAEAEAPPAPEEPKEKEEDAAEDARPRLAPGTAAVSAQDATLNVMPSAGGKLMLSLTQGGMQYLLAGARSTVGMKSGRYMFEVRIVESLSPSESQGHQNRTPQPRQLVRVGLSTAGSSLFLGDGPDNVSFDSEGYWVYERARKKVSQKFLRDHVVAVLVNLDPTSPNANTVSIFRNGERACEPQPLPEKLQGKVLYPHITYKNVSLQVNFGPAPLAQLPFRCRTLADASKEDVEVSALAGKPSGKCEVLLPVGLPEQGYFDWVDCFLEKNPDYVEISDRKILDWAYKSGLWKPKGQSGTGSNDKPDMKFGLPMMDDLSIRKVISAVAPTQLRNYVIPELKSNLLQSERADVLARFSTCDFKRTATVVVGEPSADYKQKVQSLMLAGKKAKADAERKKKAQEEERKRLLEEKKRKAEEARKAKEAAQKRKEGKEAKEEKADEAKEEEEKKEEAPKEEEVPLELTEEEKAMWYRKLDSPDMDEKSLSKAYASFSLPKAEEGFDAVTYAWQSEAQSAELLKTWVLERKKTQKVEDLQPGASFKELWSNWTKTLQEWRKIQTEYKDPAKRKALLARRKEEAKKRKTESGEGEGNGEEKKEEEEKPKEIDVDELDVFSVEDVTDIGNGEPLFQHFVYEDWVLLSTRYELHLLMHSFKKDLDDPDRTGFTQEHMAFYYSKYFKKSFSLKLYAVEKFDDFLDLIKETVNVNSTSRFLEATFDEDTPLTNFVKITEDHRRERTRRIDAGDETAKLKFNKPAPPPPKQGAASSQSGSARSGYGGSRPGSAAPAARTSSSSSYAGSRSAPVPPRRDGGNGSARYGSGGGSGGYSTAPRVAPPQYGQKRPYSSGPPASSWSGSGGGAAASKYSRTSSYSGGGGGGGSSYRSGGGGSSYYRR